MTITEYRAALDTLDHQAFEVFRQKFGGDVRPRESFVDEFVHHPEYERRICQLLGLVTQEERHTSAAVTSAEAARDSAKSARLSMLWAGLAVAVSIVALAIATLG